MNYKKIVKIVSFAVLTTAFGQAVAMEIPKEELDRNLLNAAANGLAEQAIKLLDQGADINCKDKDGQTPLMWASQNGHFKITELLIKNGANSNDKNNFSNTPLILALITDHPQIAQRLIEHGADVNYKTKSGWTPLLYASKNGPLALVQLLLNHDADINCEDPYGFTPLMCAARNSRLAIAQLLLEHSVAIDCKNTRGQTALDIANQCSCGEHAQIAELLINEPQRRINRAEKKALLLEKLLKLGSPVFSHATQQAQSNPALAQAIQEQKQYNDTINNNLALLACGLPRK
jgi:hypothetical protein